MAYLANNTKLFDPALLSFEEAGVLDGRARLVSQ